ncbi:triple tyrosine motif-containing protein [Vibrio sinaloensis]|nr:triple tyrosine motif-containing protein [Vibrio sinaloensis]
MVGRRHGLPIDKLFQVVSDQTGYFWLTSNRGIWRIAIDQAHAIADGMESQVRFEHYNERDGMRTAQVNGGSSPAATVDSSGTLWFPTAKGVASTNPQYYSDSVITTFPTAIEQVKVDQSVLELGNSQPFELAAGSQRISFDYVGLGYLSSQHIRYQTKLEGLENQWVTRGSQTTADYTNLSPGHYTFVVKAYYQHHESDVNQASVSFVILPHWWQRKKVYNSCSHLCSSHQLPFHSGGDCDYCNARKFGSRAKSCKRRSHCRSKRQHLRCKRAKISLLD